MFSQRVSFAQYVYQYVAPFLRRPRLLGLLSVLVSPLQTYRDQLTSSTYPQQERAARYNAQVLRFERILQRALNSSLITISADGLGQRTYLYNSIELLPLYSFNEAEGTDQATIYNEGEYYPTYDFTVNVPQPIYNAELPRLRAVIQKYKLAGTTYRIRAFEVQAQSLPTPQ